MDQVYLYPLKERIVPYINAKNTINISIINSIDNFKEKIIPDSFKLNFKYPQFNK